MSKEKSAGKGDKPRNCFSKKFKNNYDLIEFRPKGSYCEECGLDLKFPNNKAKHWNGHSWVCNINKDCNFN